MPSTSLLGKSRTHIIVSGLTAVGKTTHALLLAQQFGMDYLSASSLMLKLMSRTSDGNNRLWVNHLDAIEAERDATTVDQLVNEYLCTVGRNRTPTIFDSWAMPFLASRDSSIREQSVVIELTSNQNSRAMKCVVSQGPNPDSSLDEAGEVVQRKDDSTRERFVRDFDFDIFDTARMCDVTVDLSKHVFGTAPSQVMRGVRQAHEDIIQHIEASLA